MVDLPLQASAVARAVAPELQPEDCPVWSSNEWDPLEEVIVGNASGACWPGDHAVVRACMPTAHQALLRERSGQRMPSELLAAAERELDALSRRLESEGIDVRRPEPQRYDVPFSTPNWTSAAGLYGAMPRDLALVVKDTIIEAPMAWRCRYFEVNAYRDLFCGYFQRGARWIAAPRPRLLDAAYHDEGSDSIAGTVCETEPLFDAADFLRFDNLMIGQLSNVTNRLGVEWLRRHLPSGVQLELITPSDSKPMHIDATLLPLGEGKLILNPERLSECPASLTGWEARAAPFPTKAVGPPLYMSSDWLSMNLLSLDCERVLVEAQETGMADFLRSWGFEPIPVAFRNFQALGGSFHCATLDIRRRPPMRRG